MQINNVVSREEWLAARKEHLAKEKEFTRLRDELNRDRRSLPWVKVTKDYRFTGPGGEESLADLFEGRSQLIVYHFMFDPEWEEGCKSCSFVSDHFDHAVDHINQRDVTLVAVSRAPQAKLQAFKQRLGWNFEWLSSQDSDFNFDFHVSFSPAEKEKGEIYYNFGKGRYFSSEAPGISVFFKDDNGDIYHTYSSYARGLDMFIGAYHLLDIVPKGRDEDDLPYTMAWVKLRDLYEEDAAATNGA